VTCAFGQTVATSEPGNEKLSQFDGYGGSLPNFITVVERETPEGHVERHWRVDTSPDFLVGSGKVHGPLKLRNGMKPYHELQN